MLSYRWVASRSFVLLSAVLIVGLVTAADFKGQGAERLLTAAEMLTSFGGDGSGQTCGPNPNCSPNNAYTQTCDSLSGVGSAYCTQVLKYTGSNANSCVADTNCPSGSSSCALTGASEICSSTYSCIPSTDPSGVFYCRPGTIQTSQYNQTLCASLDCFDTVLGTSN